MKTAKNIKIIKNVLKRAKTRTLWVREISRRSRIPVATATRCIRKMEKEGIVKSSIRGKIKEVKLLT